MGQIRQPQQDAAISAGLSSYLVYQEGSGSSASSGGAQFGQALVNALVIVGVIAAATFVRGRSAAAAAARPIALFHGAARRRRPPPPAQVLVLCYYFRCLKLMVGYLIFASVNLLGYSGGFMAISAIQLLHWPVDWLTLAVVMYNFAIGGAVAVFWQKGIPRVVTQGYLIAVSVIMSWLVTKLPEASSGAQRGLRAGARAGRARALTPPPPPPPPPFPPFLRSGRRGRCSSCSRCTTCAPC